MNNRGFVIMAFVVGLFSCYLTTVMGGTAHCYTVDFAWMLYIPIIYIIFDLYDKAKEHNVSKYALIVILSMTIFMVVLNGLLCFSQSTTDMAANNPEVFYRIKELVIFWN